MQSELDRAKSAALLQTTFVCLVLECLVLLVLRLVTGNFLEAAVNSVFCWARCQSGQRPGSTDTCCAEINSHVALAPKTARPDAPR